MFWAQPRRGVCPQPPASGRCVCRIGDLAATHRQASRRHPVARCGVPAFSALSRSACPRLTKSPWHHAGILIKVLNLRIVNLFSPWGRRAGGPVKKEPWLTLGSPAKEHFQRRTAVADQVGLRRIWLYVFGYCRNCGRGRGSDRLGKVSTASPQLTTSCALVVYRAARDRNRLSPGTHPGDGYPQRAGALQLTAPVRLKIAGHEHLGFICCVRCRGRVGRSAAVTARICQRQ